MRGRQAARAIEQGGGQWYVDPATRKGASSFHVERGSTHSPPPRNPLQRLEERGQKRPPGATIALISRLPKIQVLEADEGPVAAEPPSRPTSKEGAKDIDFMDKVKKGLKYIEREDADLER